MSKESDEKDGYYHEEVLARMIFSGLLPIVLLVGGLVLLYLRLPGWSMIFGLPMTVIGTVFLIYSYDDFVSGKIMGENVGIAECRKCGKPTIAAKGQDPKLQICVNCRKKLSSSKSKD